MAEPDVSIPPPPTSSLPSELPVVPLRETVVLPMTVAPLGVGRTVSIEAINRALAGDRMVLLLLQRGEADEPSADDLHRVGTVAIIRQMAKAPTGMRVLVEGVARARAEFLQNDRGYIRALLKPLPESAERSIDIDARVRRLQELVDRALSLATGLSPDIKTLVMSLDDPLRIAYLLASLLDMKADDKQRLLEENSLIVKLDAVSMVLSREIEVLELKGQIESKAEKEMTDAQRQYVLRQQMKAIQTELGEGDGEAGELRNRVAEANLPESVAAIANREVDRLERMTPASPEYQMIRTYLDWVLDVPWDKPTEDRLDPIEARTVLDADHYDLDKVKERIVEYLAVRKLKGDLKGPILCFVGPPGVGKTSLGQSIARSMNRKFVRIPPTSGPLGVGVVLGAEHDVESLHQAPHHPEVGVGVEEGTQAGHLLAREPVHALHQQEPGPEHDRVVGSAQGAAVGIPTGRHQHLGEAPDHVEAVGHVAGVGQPLAHRAVDSTRPCRSPPPPRPGASLGSELPGSLQHVGRAALQHGDDPAPVPVGEDGGDLAPALAHRLLVDQQHPAALDGDGPGPAARPRPGPGP